MSTEEEIEEGIVLVPRKPKTEMELDTDPTLPLLPIPAQIIESAVKRSPEAEAEVIASIGRGKAAGNLVGLSRVQRKFLLNRALLETDSAACKYAGICIREFNKWKKNDPIFMRGYAQLWIDPSDFTVTAIKNLLPKGVEVLEAILEHGKDSDKLKAVRMVMESDGILKPSGGEGGNEYERLLAKQLIERNIPLPPALRQYAPDYVEGEYSEMLGTQSTDYSGT